MSETEPTTPDPTPDPPPPAREVTRDGGEAPPAGDGWVRVKGRPSAVRHPEHGGYVVPDARQPYRPDDPLVAAYPWMFESDTETTAVGPAPASVSLRPVERATRAPGERRPGRRR